MKELQTGGKVVQQMTKDGAVELNKVTGSAERISARKTETIPAASNVRESGNAAIGAADRVLTERKAAKKRAVRKANAKIYERSHQTPDASRLSFREREKPPNGKLTHALERPGREAAFAAHSQIRKSEDGNSGTEAAHSAEQAAEGTARAMGQGYRSMKLQPQRAALRAEQKSIKANANALYERSLRSNPELQKASLLKKQIHKQRIKREYAKAHRKGTLGKAKKSAKRAKKTAEEIKKAAVRIAAFVLRNKKVVAIVIIVLLLLILLFSGASLCVSMFSGGFNTVLTTSYTAEDADILGAGADYTALETNLAIRVGNIESEFPGYDEYRYFLDKIGHDPYVLASYFTAKYNMYTRDQVQADLIALFAQQYTLTVTATVEIRYRTETFTGSYTTTDPETGEITTHYYTYTEEVPYEYHILTVTLINRSLESIVINNLTPEQQEMYHVYMETKGNRPDLFEDNPYASRRDYLHYEVPPEALSDARFAAILAEAEKHLGMPYVWGGSSPATGFDCSGYVSWVINNSGWNVGRLGAKALYNICTPVSPADAKPGDLVFFWRTYNAPDPNAPTHVGIYVGNGMMIHCGNPISYASITTNYWVSKFYGFGRLP